MALYELRQYKVRSGKMPDWLSMMEESIIPYVVSKGMVVSGSFRSETDESVYIWIRRFEDEQHKVALYEAVYESEHWTSVLSPQIGVLLDREAAIVHRLLPTRLSTMQ